MAIFQLWFAIAPYIADIQKKLHDALFDRKTILLEGAQGALLISTSAPIPL